MPPQITNLYARYYIDWLIALLTCVIFCNIVLTPPLFFAGMCLYIGELVDDLRATLTELVDVPDISTQRIIDEISFHIDLSE